MFKFITNCFSPQQEEELPLYSESDIIFEEPKKIVTIEEFDNKKMINNLLDYTDINKHETLVCIIETGDLDLIKWLDKNGIFFSNLSLSRAMSCGKLDVVKFLYEKGYPFDNIGIISACINGHLDVIKWVYENNIDFHIENAIKNAIEGNQQHVVEYLKSITQ